MDLYGMLLAADIDEDSVAVRVRVDERGGVCKRDERLCSGVAAMGSGERTLMFQ